MKSRSLLTSAAVAASVLALAMPAQAAERDVQPKDLVDDASAIMELTYTEFADVAHDEPFDWSNDGCSSPVPGDPYREVFKPACDQHDFGYRNFGSKGELALDPTEARKAAIDEHFKQEMKRICEDEGKADECVNAAEAYYQAVDKFGDSSFFG